jgi:hypothetical protein
VPHGGQHHELELSLGKEEVSKRADRKVEQQDVKEASRTCICATVSGLSRRSGPASTSSFIASHPRNKSDSPRNHPRQ